MTPVGLFFDGFSGFHLWNDTGVAVQTAAGFALMASIVGFDPWRGWADVVIR